MDEILRIGLVLRVMEPLFRETYSVPAWHVGDTASDGACMGMQRVSCKSPYVLFLNSAIQMRVIVQQNSYHCSGLLIFWTDGQLSISASWNEATR
jgi:hypothetical protein